MKHILVVDDEFDILEALRTILEFEGYQVTTCENGKEGIEALEKLRERPPDLALLDVMMPHVSGLEMVKRIQASDAFKHMPVVLMSAVRPKAPDGPKPWVAYLQKPFSLEVLLQTLSQALSSTPRADAAVEATVLLK